MNYLVNIFNKVKSDLCELVDYKLRGETIEIITAISTVNQSFVSVFISLQNENYIISDGGWIDTNEYETEEDDHEDLTTIIDQQLVERYGIKVTESKVGISYYYKNTKDINVVSAMVFDVANYISTYVSYRSIIIKNLNNTRRRKPQFKTKINKFLKAKYSSGEVTFNERIKIDDEYSIRFSSVVRPRINNSRAFTMMYINGSKLDDFNDSIARATSHFQIINKYAKNKSYFEKIAIINTSSPGYDVSGSLLFTRNLTDVMGKKPVLISDESSLETLDELLPQSYFLG